MPRINDQQRQRGNGLLTFVLVTALTLLAVTQAHAQSRPKLKDVNDRLIRVENILDQSLLNLLQQIQKLEGEVRILRGELESQTNDISQLKRQLDRNSDNSQRRIDELQQRLDAAPPAGFLDDSGDDGNGGSGQVLDPSDETAAARDAVGGGASADIAEASAEETEAYRNAYDLLETDRYDESIAAFEDFLGEFPISPYADNALYWQGEAMYAKRSFEDAIVNFNVLIESFRSSPKVPDAKLKIGYALYEQSRYGDARAMLNSVVSEYDGRAASVLARKRLGEMDANGL